MAELLKRFWVLLYAWAIPSALALGATWRILLPQLDSLCFLNDYVEKATKDKEAQVFILITFVLAIFLRSLSTLLYRLLEGYYYWPEWARNWGEKRQRAKIEKHKHRTAAAGPGWRRDLELERLARYPQEDSQVLPTKFGNAIRAFTTYGKTRFKLDSQTLWYELLAVAPKYLQTEIDSARSYVDFWVSSCYLSGFFGFMCLILGAFDHFNCAVLLLGAVALLLAFLCHWLAIQAIDDWSYPVVALVNFGRVKLADSLGLKLPETLEEERKMWGLVTTYTYGAKQEDGIKLDAYRKAPTEQPAAEQLDGEAENGGNGNGNDDTSTA